MTEFGPLQGPSPEGADCAYCLGRVALAESVGCPKCRVLYHPDCWKANRERCAVYGCEPAVLAPVPPPAPRPRPPPLTRRERITQPLWRHGWVFMIVVINLTRCAMTDRPRQSSHRPPVEQRESFDALEYHQRALRRHAAKDYPGAFADYTLVIQYQPWNAHAWHNRGATRVRMDDADGALQDFSKAIALDATHAAAWSARGALRAQRGDTQGAIVDFTRALELAPNDAQAREQLRELSR